jgi:ABC-2 type transport system permease protein
VNTHRVATVIRRHAYVLRRSPHRFFDVTFWPFMDVLVFGSLGAFVSRENAATKAGTPYLLAGIMLFHVLFQVQVGVATGFLEETWSRNLLNVMTTPVTESEYALGIGVFGLAKLVMALVTLTVTGFVFYGFHLDRVGIALIPAVAILLVFGWAISLVVIGLVLRFGPSAEILTWGLNYVALALSGVFNPIDALPGALQPVARVFPSTRAFAAARNALDGHPLDWGNVAMGLFGALVAAALGLWFVTTMLKVFRRRGFVTRFS